MDNSFWWGTKVNPFLFKGFSVNSNGGLIGLCLIVFIMAFCFEFLRFLQIKNKHRELVLRVKQLKLLCTTESASLLATTVENPRNPLNITLFYRFSLVSSEISLWLLLQVLGYFLMLSIMIYDAWFLVAAVLGGGFGYFVFGNLFMKMNIQNCQIMRSAFCTQICGETDMKEGQSTPAILETPNTSSYQDCSSSHERTEQTTQVSVHTRCH